MISNHGYNQNNGSQRRWPRISWWYTLILPVAVAAIGVTWLLSPSDSSNDISGVVRDAYTGQPVAGAEVATAGTVVTTDDEGEFSFDSPNGTPPPSLAVERENYQQTQVPVSPGRQQIDINLRPTTLTGVVTNSRSGDPVSGAAVVASGPDASKVTSVTNDDGEYTLSDVPEEATVTVTHDGFSQASKPVENSVVLDFEIYPDVITGRVRNGSGEPVPGATVQVGEATTQTDGDGAYHLSDAPPDGGIVVKKAGYRTVRGEYPDDMTFDATLERLVVKALYVTAMTAADDESWNRMLDIADRTEVNAIVLDLKDSSGTIHYETEVPMAREIGAWEPTYDLADRIQDLRDHDLYAIARIVVFEDPLLAERKPELAIRDDRTGELWKTWNGLAWVNAYRPEVWQYNIDIALEAVNAGFDEIQLDYIRFPTDGLVEQADYGEQYNDQPKADAIVEFLSQARDALNPTGAYLAVDIFGFALWDEGDAGIGQNLERIEPLVDVINPMIYPSHFGPGEMGFDYPNDHPYQVILWSLQNAQARIGDKNHKFRPWLQDFSYGPGIEYGADEVAAQIAAAEEFGTSGWMLWNAANVYHTEALQPE